MPIFSNVNYVLEKLQWMRDENIWPNGLRYLWTDAFGIVLLLSLHQSTCEDRYLSEAKSVVSEVNRTLRRKEGFRIGEAADREGQYYHYLTMWIFALSQLGKYDPAYKAEAVQIAKEIHPRFYVPNRGVIWKMSEDLSGPYPGFLGYGSLDAFEGYAVYKNLDAIALREEIADLKKIVDRVYKDIKVSQDLAAGMLLWDSHLCSKESWARVTISRVLRQLDEQWVDDPEGLGFFAREPSLKHVRIAFSNYGVSLGLQSVLKLVEDEKENPQLAHMSALMTDQESEKWMSRVQKLNEYFETYQSSEALDDDAITHVMACCSHLPGLFIQGGFLIPESLSSNSPSPSPSPTSTPTTATSKTTSTTQNNASTNSTNQGNETTDAVSSHGLSDEQPPPPPSSLHKNPLCDAPPTPASATFSAVSTTESPGVAPEVGETGSRTGTGTGAGTGAGAGEGAGTDAGAEARAGARAGATGSFTSTPSSPSPVTTSQGSSVSSSTHSPTLTNPSSTPADSIVAYHPPTANEILEELTLSSNSPPFVIQKTSSLAHVNKMHGHVYVSVSPTEVNTFPAVNSTNDVTSTIHLPAQTSDFAHSHKIASHENEA